jgi:hypothetical protein
MLVGPLSLHEETGPLFGVVVEFVGRIFVVAGMRVADMEADRITIAVELDAHAKQRISGVFGRRFDPNGVDH